MMVVIPPGYTLDMYLVLVVNSEVPLMLWCRYKAQETEILVGSGQYQGAGGFT